MRPAGGRAGSRAADLVASLERLLAAMVEEARRAIEERGEAYPGERADLEAVAGSMR